MASESDMILVLVKLFWIMGRYSSFNDGKFPCRARDRRPVPYAGDPGMIIMARHKLLVFVAFY